MARHLQTRGAHIGIFTETSIHSIYKHTMVVNTFLEYGILAISHNTTQIRKTEATAEDEELVGPKAAGVILTLTAEFAGWWIDITKGMDGRAISATIFLCDDTTARINATYGVSGASCPIFKSFTCKNIVEARLNDYITK